MEHPELKQALETLLFVTDHPLPMNQLCKLLGEKDASKVGALVDELRREFEQRGTMQVLEVAEGFQMATRPGFGAFVRKLFSDRMTMKLSSAALETLSIIAYKQPLTRAEVEEIRGVEVIAALETLLDKRLIKVVGRKETVGRPLLYGTTPDFLRHFGLKSLEDLPPIDQFKLPEAAPQTDAQTVPEAVAVPSEASEAPEGSSGEGI